MIEEYLRQTKSEIWIEHDFVANAKLKKAPAFYDEKRPHKFASPS
jgi:hypothetical protein